MPSSGPPFHKGQKCVQCNIVLFRIRQDCWIEEMFGQRNPAGNYPYKMLVNQRKHLTIQIMSHDLNQHMYIKLFVFIWISIFYFCI